MLDRLRYKLCLPILLSIMQNLPLIFSLIGRDWKSYNMTPSDSEMGDTNNNKYDTMCSSIFHSNSKMYKNKSTCDDATIDIRRPGMVKLG